MMVATESIKAMTLLLQAAKYSDLTIVCRGREFPVHRAIVCPHSPFLDAADGMCQEAHSGRIELPEDDPDAVERMISYMYTDERVSREID